MLLALMSILDGLPLMVYTRYLRQLRQHPPCWLQLMEIDLGASLLNMICRPVAALLSSPIQGPNKPRLQKVDW